MSVSLESICPSLLRFGMRRRTVMLPNVGVVIADVPSKVLHAGIMSLVAVFLAIAGSLVSRGVIAELSPLDCCPAEGRWTRQANRRG